MLTLEQLQQRVEEARAKLAKKLRNNYRLARDLKFSSVEARLLSFESEETIRRLATQRVIRNARK